jgi:putative transcription factor
MAKKNRTEYDKECPICGGLIWKGQKVLIEGAKITVCQSCAKEGKIIQDSPKMMRPKTSTKTRPSKPSKLYREAEKFEKVEIVSNYAQLIHSARTKRDLNQDQFAQKLNEKPSLLRRIEAGKVEPTLELAKKIEKTYQIKLIKEIDSIEPSAKSSQYMKKSVGSTLGDIAFVKKKK